jgi:hypothetical protein
LRRASISDHARGRHWPGRRLPRASVPTATRLS